MIANLLDVAGATHIITIDLHASQMQGFFHCPIDNLFAEPLIADHLRKEFPDYKRAVVVSKNPGGTKRVTSLADNLKLNFGIVMTDRYRVGGQGDVGSMVGSQILPPKIQHSLDGSLESKLEMVQNEREEESGSGKNTPRLRIPQTNGVSPSPLHHSVTFEPEEAERNDPKLRTESSSTQEEFDTSTNGYNEEQLDDSGSESGDEGDIDPVSSYITRVNTPLTRSLAIPRHHHRPPSPGAYRRRLTPQPALFAHPLRPIRQPLTRRRQPRRRPRILTRCHAHLLHVYHVRPPSERRSGWLSRRRSQ
jgi:hypothetical protein